MGANTLARMIVTEISSRRKPCGRTAAFLGKSRLVELALFLLAKAVGGHGELADGCSLGRVRQLSIFHTVGSILRLNISKRVRFAFPFFPRKSIFIPTILFIRCKSHSGKAV